MGDSESKEEEEEEQLTPSSEIIDKLLNDFMRRVKKVPPVNTKKRQRPVFKEAEILSLLNDGETKNNTNDGETKNNTNDGETGVNKRGTIWWWWPGRMPDADLSKEAFDEKFTDKDSIVLTAVTANGVDATKALLLEAWHSSSAQPGQNAVDAVDAQLQIMKDPDHVTVHHDATVTRETPRRLAQDKEEVQDNNNKPDDKKPDNNKPGDNKPDDKSVNKSDNKSDNEPSTSN
jgi:hypothetical protein